MSSHSSSAYQQNRLRERLLLFGRILKDEAQGIGALSLSDEELHRETDNLFDWAAKAIEALRDDRDFTLPTRSRIQ